ncbi:Uncharacterized protein OBRU01_13127 [Operophtera brumata]|uniref:Uncharacterized protein n=1 Tax=Operophtera brumata TaxID=104452 RepID=A0A0L7L8F7_OPEBR|nr:Uncharacterized protein OBRU01_13127 [Operophtera brumata]
MVLPKEIGHQVRFGKSLIELFRRGCWEIPEIMGASGMAIVGLGLALIGLSNYAKNDGDNKEYKSYYCVIRSDDPRAKLIRNPVKTEY